VDVRRGVVTDALAIGDSGRVRVTLRNGEAQHVDVDHILAFNGSAPDASCTASCRSTSATPP